METGKKAAKGVRSRKPSPTRSDTMRALWTDPSYRKRLSKKRREAANKRWADPEARKKLMDGQKKSVVGKKAWWAKPANRKMMMEVRKEQAQRPEVREAITEGMDKKWEDDRWYQKMVCARKKQAEKPAEKIRKQKTARYLWQDPEYRAKQMESRHKTMYGSKWRAKVSASLKGREVWNKGLTKDTDERLMKASKRMQGRIPDYAKMRRWYPSDAVHKIWMRSGWEVGYALYLDGKGVKWEYEQKKFFVGSGRWTGVTYTPDFYLPATGWFVEIKGWEEKGWTKKFAEFSKRNPDVKIKVLRQSQLRRKGVTDIHGNAMYRKN